jgi:D-3-phosphoglycerate dehydrogenase
MASPRNIPAVRPEAVHRQSVSTSPTATFHSSFGGGLPQRALPKLLKPFNTQDIKILLLENVNQSGRDVLTDQGYQVEALKSSLPEDQLIEKIRSVSYFGCHGLARISPLSHLPPIGPSWPALC